MATHKKLTGREVEALGAMKFDCDTCRDIFPVRCDEHRRLPDSEPEEKEPDPPSLKLLLIPRVPPRKVLAFGRPIAGYDAPYEMLTAQIERIPLGVRD